ncbi:dicarboxylate/amino acid:cation symporter [Lujinxingia vulgaris]|uniref:Dicarboxylate/amino acid:cation symporter n=1 Tax=Lujinxingia vulgaris TaxID=2600176 RepID=A0A5C6XJD6_9DELT|nr:dicarboxylate/amino acid:cation symporter [Lujinxingia vulgaris]TXD43752.1 dicarboxylate/amino acid:cation symporter [Lujinxingia vulgaris]
MRKIKLHWWILLGMVAGVVWGMALHGAYYETLLEQARQQVLGQGYRPDDLIGATREINTALQGLMNQTPAGAAADGLAELFLALLRMIVIPLVFASLVCGVTGMRDFARLRRIGARAAGWYVTTSLLAIVLGLILVNLFKPGVGLEMPMAIGEVDIPAPSGPWEMLLSVVPTNVVAAAANFDLLGLIFFAILFGIFALQVEEPFLETIDGFFQAVFAVMMKMTLFVIALAPVGIAALIARLLAITGPEALTSVVGYAGTVAAALLLHGLLTLPLLFWLLTRRNPYRVLGAMGATLLTAFSTASSAGTLGMTLEQLEDNVGVKNEVGGFVLPLGATINMDGTALYECVAVLFIAQVYASANPDFVLTFGTQLTIVVLALMVSIGAAGIPHAGLVMMVIIFEAVGLPLELIALLWAIDRPLDMMRTMINVWSDSIGATAIAHFEDAIDESKLFAPESEDGSFATP